ncbi:hypothetical protein CVT25_004740 [Psilocybe cyanescens]|uniref:Uncharacterized protein n=1 Tax=Psilocybe cyanescens TaxID=93625 RepID=A0A409XGH8_PSICY|nr:hypothetical protein CVT25_004740 [Psilocybe cyanescens]
MPHLFSIKRIKSTFFSPTVSKNIPPVASEPPNPRDKLQKALEELKVELMHSLELEKEAHCEGRTVALQWAQRQSEGYRLQIEETKKKLSLSLMMKVIRKAKSLHF